MTPTSEPRGTATNDTYLRASWYSQKWHLPQSLVVQTKMIPTSEPVFLYASDLSFFFQGLCTCEERRKNERFSHHVLPHYHYIWPFGHCICHPCYILQHSHYSLQGHHIWHGHYILPSDHLVIVSAVLIISYNTVIIAYRVITSDMVIIPYHSVSVSYHSVSVSYHSVSSFSASLSLVLMPHLGQKGWRNLWKRKKIKLNAEPSAYTREKINSLLSVEERENKTHCWPQVSAYTRKK